MSRLRSLWGTAVGLKFVVAVTGLVLFAWVALHMLGNLKTFLGATPAGTPEIDLYAAGLKSLGAPFLPHGFALWASRIVLLACAVLHMAAVYRLWVMNRAARPVPYARFVPARATVAARYMLVTGPLILAYVVLHVLHFTTGTVRPAPFEEGRVYANLYHSFRVGGVVLFYVAAVALLALHLYHGVWSFFQTVGIDNPDRNRKLRAFAAASAILVFAGFASVPLAFLLGALPETPGAR